MLQSRKKTPLVDRWKDHRQSNNIEDRRTSPKDSAGFGGYPYNGPLPNLLQPIPIPVWQEMPIPLNTARLHRRIAEEAVRNRRK
jgi:hypothetical protein